MNKKDKILLAISGFFGGIGFTMLAFHFTSTTKTSLMKASILGRRSFWCACSPVCGLSSRKPNDNDRELFFTRVGEDGARGLKTSRKYPRFQMGSRCRVHERGPAKAYKQRSAGLIAQHNHCSRNKAQSALVFRSVISIGRFPANGSTAINTLQTPQRSYSQSTRSSTPREGAAAGCSLHATSIATYQSGLTGQASCRQCSSNYCWIHRQRRR